MTTPLDLDAIRQDLSGTTVGAGPARKEVTDLPPQREPEFAEWAHRYRVTDLDHPDSHYDYRGAFLAGATPDAAGHWPDTWKQHGEPTFSVESKYSTGPDDGGRWQDGKFVKPGTPRPPVDLVALAEDLKPKAPPGPPPPPKLYSLNEAARRITDAASTPAILGGGDDAIQRILDQTSPDAINHVYRFSRQATGPTGAELLGGSAATGETLKQILYMEAMGPVIGRFVEGLGSVGMAALERASPELALGLQRALSGLAGRGATVASRGVVGAAGGAAGGAAFGAGTAALENQPIGEGAKVGAEVGGTLGGVVGAVSGAAYRVPPRINRTPSGKDPFQVLGLDPRTATPADVERAFRDMALKHHPDVPPDVRAERGGPVDPTAADAGFRDAVDARQAANDYLEKIGRRGTGQPTAPRQPGPAVQRGRRLPKAPVDEEAAARAEAEQRYADQERKQREQRGRETLEPLPAEGEGPARGFVVTGKRATPPVPPDEPWRQGGTRGMQKPVTTPVPAPAPRYDYVEARGRIHDAIEQMEDAAIAGRRGEAPPDLTAAEQTLAAEQPRYEQATGGTYVSDLRRRIADAKALSTVPKAQDVTEPAYRQQIEHLDAAHAGTVEGQEDQLRAYVSFERALRTPGATAEQRGALQPYIDVIHRRLEEMPHASITYDAPAGPDKVVKEALARDVAGIARNFAPIAVMREQGATDRQIIEHVARALGRQGGRQGGDDQLIVSWKGGKSPWYKVAVPSGAETKLAGQQLAKTIRAMFKIPKPGGPPTTQMPHSVPAAAEPGVSQETPEVVEETAPKKKKSGNRPVGTEKVLARHAELTAQIARDEQVAAHHTTQYTAPGNKIKGDEPHLLFTRTAGSGYSALGRLRQAERRLKDLEKLMTAEELAEAHKRAPDIASAAALEANEKVNAPAEREAEAKRGMEALPERQAIEGEGVAPGAPHDEAAVQEGLFGEPTLKGKEQAELLPETAGVPTAKLKGTKIGPEDVGRVKREGAEPEGEVPGELIDANHPEYEDLARKLASNLGQKLRGDIEKALVAAGHDEAEVKAMGDADLSHRALNDDILSPQQQSDVLDVLWASPQTGAIGGGRPKMPAQPSTSPARSIRDEFRRQLYPEKRGQAAVDAGRLLRRHIGEWRRGQAVRVERLKDFRSKVPSLKTPEGIQWYDRAEGGKAQVSPELQEPNDIIRKFYTDLTADVQNLGTGKLETPIENYMAHIWEDPAKAKDQMGRMMGRRPLQGGKTFLRQRSIPKVVDGLKAGLKPVTDNPIDLNLLKMREMSKYVMAHRFMADAKEEGLAQFFTIGKSGPDGWTRIDDPTFAVYGRSDEGELVIRGHYWMPEVAARVVNNYLSPGLRGNPIFDAWMGLGNALNQATLGVSGFHAGFVTFESVISDTARSVGRVLAGQNPLKGFRGPAASLTYLVRGVGLRRAYLNPGTGGILEQRMAAMLARAGGQHVMDPTYQNNSVANLKKAIRNNQPIRALIHTAGAVLQGLAYPTMELYVPLVKLGAFAQLAESELERLGPLASDADVDKAMQSVYHSIDNRFGQVSYDTRFWNNAVKHALMASIRAVGWDAGSVDELVGGLRDALREKKDSLRLHYLIALPLVAGLLSILWQYALTGEGPESVQDVYEPRDGTHDQYGNPNRMTLATYMKDIIHFGRHPVRTVEGKLHPVLSFLGGIISNRDFYGNKWRNPHDPLTQQLKQFEEYVRESFTPISIRNVQEAKRRGESAFRVITPFFGITPASREAIRTPAQNLMAELLHERTPPLTPAQRQRADSLGLQRAEESGDDKLVRTFRRLTPDERAMVYKVANAHERELWAPWLERRRGHG